MPDILYPTHKLFEATQILVHASTEDVASSASLHRDSSKLWLAQICGNRAWTKF